jgi:hypothetical protein
MMNKRFAGFGSGRLVLNELECRECLVRTSTLAYRPPSLPASAAAILFWVKCRDEQDWIRKFRCGHVGNGAHLW